MFQGSYPAVTEVVKKLKEKQEFVNFHKARVTASLQEESNQLLLEISFGKSRTQHLQTQVLPTPTRSNDWMEWLLPVKFFRREKKNIQKAACLGETRVLHGHIHSGSRVQNHNPAQDPTVSMWLRTSPWRMYVMNSSQPFIKWKEKPMSTLNEVMDQT